MTNLTKNHLYRPKLCYNEVTVGDVMKKFFIIIFVSIVLCTGCSISRVDTTSINNIITTILYSENKLYNSYMEGYKLYIPKGMTIVDKQDYNLKVKDNTNYYFIYIDTIAYYFKTENRFLTNADHFYSERMENGDKFGYIDITEEEDGYFIVVMYNYAKAEAYVEKDKLYDALAGISNILSTVTYNDDTISKRIESIGAIGQEESFDIFDSKKEKDNFLTYKEEYGTFSGTIINDPDIVDVEENN